MHVSPLSRSLSVPTDEAADSPLDPGEDLVVLRHEGKEPRRDGVGGQQPDDRGDAYRDAGVVGGCGGVAVLVFVVPVVVVIFVAVVLAVLLG